MEKRRKVCCICGKEYEGWGNNPYPVKENGECCRECNMTQVIPARVRLIRNHKIAEQ